MPDMKELKAKTAPEETPDRHAVHFQATAKKKGIALRRDPLVRAWILHETTER